jgi:hypothetical protein
VREKQQDRNMGDMDVKQTERGHIRLNKLGARQHLTSCGDMHNSQCKQIVKVVLACAQQPRQPCKSLKGDCKAPQIHTAQESAPQ